MWHWRILGHLNFQSLLHLSIKWVTILVLKLLLDSFTCQSLPIGEATLLKFPKTELQPNIFPSFGSFIIFYLSFLQQIMEPYIFQRSERTCFVTPCMSLVVNPPCMSIVHIAKKVYMCIWSWWWWLRQRKNFTMINTNKYISFFCHRSFWLPSSTSEYFFHQCINVVWLAKDINGPPLTILHAFYRPNVSIVLQRMRIISILRCVIIPYEGSSRLIALLCFPFPFFFSGGRPKGSKHNLKFQSATWPQAPSQ